MRESWRVLPGLIVALAVLVVYAQAIGGPLVWDDRYLIIDVPLVEKGAPLVEYLKRPLWSGEGVQHLNVAYYRPLVTLSFAFDHWLHGTNSAGYHVTNIAIHCSASVALFVLLRRVGARPWTAAVLASGWALLPRLAEVGAWISGRADGLAGLFVFLALIAWGPSLGRRSLAATLLALGLLAKETAGAGLAALLCFEWVRARPLPLRRRALAVAFASGPLLVVLGGYLGLRLTLLGYDVHVDSLGPLGRSRTVLETIATYAEMLLDPLRPRALIGRVGPVTTAGTVIGTCVFGGILAIVWRLRTRIGETQALGFGLFAFAIAPVLHVVPIPVRTLAADRFLYLPTAGLILGVSPTVDRWLGERRGAWVGACAVIAVLFVGTLRRVAVWSNEIDFWVETNLHAPPTNHAAAVELSGVYFRAGRVKEALELSERALRFDDPNQRNPLRNSAVCLARLGRRPAALERLNESAAGHLKGEDALLAALIQIQDGNFEAAQSLLERISGSNRASAQPLIAQLPSLRSAYQELAHLDASAPPDRRARLATLLGDHVQATPAWIATMTSPTTSRPLMLEGLRYLVQAGDREALTRATRAYIARFGLPTSELANMIEVRLDELDQLSTAARRLNL